MKQANKNFITNILYLIINIAIGVLYTPYLVKHVGIIAYGIVPLALIINQYINVISLPLINALTRFYSVEYRKGNFNNASKYLSTSIVVSIIFTIILYPLMHIAINYIDLLFDIPETLLDNAILLFRLTIASFFISIISNCLNTTLFSNNLLNYVNYLKIVRQTSKFILNIIFFICIDINIIYIGWSNFISEMLVLILNIFFYKKTKPQYIHCDFKLYDKKYLIAMLGMIIWVLVQRFSDTFLYKIDSVLMNLFFGIKMTGIIGAISEFGSYVISITTILVSLFGPLLLIAYSQQKYKDYIEKTIHGGYLVGLFSSLLCALLCGSASLLLKIWLGAEFEQYSSWMIIKLLIIPYTTVGAIYSNSYLYANYNKYPALLSIVIALFNIIINVFILNIQPSINIFLIICFTFMLIQGFVMNIFFYNRLYPGKLKEIIILTSKYTIYFILLYFITLISSSLYNIENIYQLLILYSILFCIGIIILDSIFLSNKQRNMLYEILPLYKTIRLTILNRIIR